jgi:hypothetical protein
MKFSAWSLKIRSSDCRKAPTLGSSFSVLPGASRATPSLPITLPATEQRAVRIFGAKNRFVFGVYRREMRTIRYLGEIDKVVGRPATTRNWNTILAIARILQGETE